MEEQDETSEPFAPIMDRLFEGLNVYISDNEASIIGEFLRDNYPDTRLIELRSGEYYLEEGHEVAPVGQGCLVTNIETNDVGL